MFTGLIEVTGVVVQSPGLAGPGSAGRAPVADPQAEPASAFRLGIRTALAPELQLGESVAVNGVCLTVTGIEGDEWFADVGPETARVTTLGALAPGARVNLERSLRADSRMGGHMVQGHVDGVGIVERVRAEGEAHWITLSCDTALLPLLVRKGAVAVDGISLTVAGLDGARFDVMVIPFTWTHTNLSQRREGDRVNIECDVVGKYVARAVELFGAQLGDATLGRGRQD
jgi:riboflavin synthase